MFVLHACTDPPTKTNSQHVEKLIIILTSHGFLYTQFIGLLVLRVLRIGSIFNSRRTVVIVQFPIDRPTDRPTNRHTAPLVKFLDLVSHSMCARVFRFCLSGQTPYIYI